MRCEGYEGVTQGISYEHRNWMELAQNRFQARTFGISNVNPVSYTTRQLVIIPYQVSYYIGEYFWKILVSASPF